MAKKNPQAAQSAAPAATNEGNGNGAAAAAAPKAKYETMIVGVSKARKPLRDKLEALATKLGCKPSDVLWYAVEQAIENPPTSAPAGASANVGSSPGFWVQAVQDGKGKAVGVKVVEVENRGDENGRTFFRFKRGEVKERGRAKAQAIRAAQADASMIGFKGEIAVEELEEAAAE